MHVYGYVELEAKIDYRFRTHYERRQSTDRASQRKTLSILPTLLSEFSEWNIDDGYESGVCRCQLESSPEP
jgi:hypothetical protein